MIFNKILLGVMLSVFSVYAAHPKMAPVTSRFKIAQVTVRNQMNSVLSLAVDGINATCTDRLQETVTAIGNKSIDELNSCYLSAEQSMHNAATLEQSNEIKVVDMANALINRLNICAQINTTANTTNTELFQCFVDDFDKNLQAVDEISSNSQLALMGINEMLSSIQIEAYDCINLFTMEAKLNMTKAYNDELDCLQYGITTTPDEETTTTTAWETTTAKSSD